MCCSGGSIAPCLHHSLVGLIYSAYKKQVVGVEPVLVFSVWLERKMRSSSAVLGNPSDCRSGMVFRAIVHFMNTASKKC